MKSESVRNWNKSWDQTSITHVSLFFMPYNQNPNNHLKKKKNHRVTNSYQYDEYLQMYIVWLKRRKSTRCTHRCTKDKIHEYCLKLTIYFIEFIISNLYSYIFKYLSILRTNDKLHFSFFNNKSDVANVGIFFTVGKNY